MKNIAKSTILVTLFLLLSKLFGFIRELILAYKFGTSYISDAYTIAVSFPNLIFAIFASGISQSYIPVFSRINPKAKTDYFNTVATFMAIISIVVSIICFVFSGKIAYFLAPGFDERSLSLTTSFIAIIALEFPFLCYFDLLSAHEQAHENFVFSYFCDFIICNLIIILSIILSDTLHSYIMIIGYIIAMVFSCVLLHSYATFNRDISYKINFNFFDKNIIQLFQMALPLGLSLLISEMNSAIDKMFSSSLGEGITGALSYANRIQSLFLTLTTTVFITMCFPRMNVFFASGDRKGGMYYVKKSISIACFFSIPFMCILMIFSVPITKYLFERGSFTGMSTVITSNCLRYYSLGIPFYAFYAVETRALVSNMRQKDILAITLISIILNTVLNFLLVRLLGYIGLPLATSISGIFMSIDRKSVV